MAKKTKKKTKIKDVEIVVFKANKKSTRFVHVDRKGNVIESNKRIIGFASPLSNATEQDAINSVKKMGRLEDDRSFYYISYPKKRNLLRKLLD
jgi:hypothetical protein